MHPSATWKCQEDPKGCSLHGLVLGAGYPLDKVLGVLPTKSLAGVPLLGLGFVPPVSATAVGRAAVAAATDPSVAPGLMDVWQLKSYESP